MILEHWFVSIIKTDETIPQNHLPFIRLRWISNEECQSSPSENINEFPHACVYLQRVMHSRRAPKRGGRGCKTGSYYFSPLSPSLSPCDIAESNWRKIHHKFYIEEIDTFVAYLGDYVVRQVSLDTDDMLDVILPFENVLDVIAMDWDPVTDEMYWAAIYDNEITIRKGKMSPPYFEVCLCMSTNLDFNFVDWSIISMSYSATVTNLEL